MQQPNFEEVIETIVARDPRYAGDAYHFIREALDHTQKVSEKAAKSEKNPARSAAKKGGATRHVTGQELLGGIRDYALRLYGPMARTVFEEWGVRACEDFGEIVFNLLEAGLLSKTQKDSREDFKGGYDFEEAFSRPFLPAAKLPPAKAGKAADA